MDIGLNQMANIRFVILTRRLRQIPFDIIKIDDFWYIDQVFHHELSNYFKQGDRLLVSSILNLCICLSDNKFKIINKTMISDRLQEGDIFKLILHSSIPFIVWVTWDAGESFTQHLIYLFVYYSSRYFFKISNYFRTMYQWRGVHQCKSLFTQNTSSWRY